LRLALQKGKKRTNPGRTAELDRRFGGRDREGGRKSQSKTHEAKVKRGDVGSPVAQPKKGRGVPPRHGGDGDAFDLQGFSLKRCQKQGKKRWGGQQVKVKREKSKKAGTACAGECLKPKRQEEQKTGCSCSQKETGQKWPEVTGEVQTGQVKGKKTDRPNLQRGAIIRAGPWTQRDGGGSV